MLVKGGPVVFVTEAYFVPFVYERGVYESIRLCDEYIDYVLPRAS